MTAGDEFGRRLAGRVAIVTGAGQGVGAGIAAALAKEGASVVLAGRTTRTLPVAVYNVLTFEQIAWGPLAAAALIVTLPVLILTVFIQREIVAGLTAGGVKGG